MFFKKLKKKKMFKYIVADADINGKGNAGKARSFFNKRKSEKIFAEP